MNQYLYKIYDSTGATFIRAINAEDIFSEPKFNHPLNAGQGQMKIKIKADFDDFDEGVSIDYGNIVRVYQIDDDNPTGQLIYTGHISKYTPFVDGRQQGVELALLGLGTLLQRAFYKNGAAFQVSHSADDVAQVFKDVIDHFNTVYSGSLVAYDASSIDTTGNTFTYEFDRAKHREALIKAFEFAPVDWFWRIDADGKIYLEEKAASATHAFTIGKDVVSIKAPKTAENLVNGYLLKTGITGSEEQYFENSASKTNYGVREATEEDTEIADTTTANAKGNAFIAENKDPKIAPTIEVNSNYDIFSIKPGHTCRVQNLDKDGNPLGENMLIVKVSYTPEKAKLTLAAHDEDFSTALNNLI